MQLTSFIGREKEMAEVKRLLATTHLLTLTGTGGTGKTRLSLQVAADLLDQFPDGVWLVELATVDDAKLVAQTIAAALGVREESEQPMPVTLGNFFRTKKLILILDNCEHVIAECAKLAESLLRACPDLQIMASSREPLGIAGERTWPVPSLSVPERWREEIRGSDAAEKLGQYEAVRLFVDRAIGGAPGLCGHEPERALRGGNLLAAGWHSARHRAGGGAHPRAEHRPDRATAGRPVPPAHRREPHRHAAAADAARAHRLELRPAHRAGAHAAAAALGFRRRAHPRGRGGRVHG